MSRKHIFVEATDLLSIPPVVLDPIAKKLSENTTSIDSLTSIMTKLSEKFSLPPIDTYKSALDKRASTIQLQSFTEGLKTLSSLPTSRTVSTASVLLLAAFLLPRRNLELVRLTST